MNYVMDSAGAWVRESREEFLARVRRFERKLQENMRDVFCPVHLCLGHEEVAADLAEHLHDEDWVFSNHRNHGHYLAKGGSEQKLWDEIMGLESGVNGGFAGSQGIADPSINFHASAIVGGLVGVATGTAYALRMDARTGIVVCIVGDGGTEAGVFWESMNFAALHRLPIAYICENNGKSVDALINERQATPIRERVEAFGISTCSSIPLALRGARLSIPSFCEVKVRLQCDHINMSSLLPKWQ